MSSLILDNNVEVTYLVDNNRKQIRWVSGGTGAQTRSVNALYSALQDLFDELGQLDDGTPMSAQTPTEYTIGAIDASDIVPWFIDDETLQHFYGGAIKTSLWTRSSGVRPGIVKVRCSANASIVYGDIGNQINLGGGTPSYGILLDVQGSGANTILWIRPTDSLYNATGINAFTGTNGDWAASSQTITCNAHTATSYGTANQVVYTGESLWANIYSLGALTTTSFGNATSDLYVYKDGVKVTGLTSGASSYQWWASGHIDILMKVKQAGAVYFPSDAAISTSTTVTLTAGNTTKLRVGQQIIGQNVAAGTTIASITGLRTFTLSLAGTNGSSLSIYANTIDGSYVSVFNREYDNTYDYFIVDLNPGGRNPIPLATGDDLNNHTGYRKYTASAGTGTFTVGEGIYVGASWALATAKGVVTAFSGTGASSVVKYYLVGDLTEIASNDDITGDFSGATITAGTVADNEVATNPKTLTGQSISYASGGYNDDIDNGNGTKYYSIEIDPGSNLYRLSTMYEYTKYVTRRGSLTSNDGINGEAYIGPDMKFSYTNTPGTFADGSIVYQASTNAYGTVITHDTTQKHVVLRNSRGTFNTSDITDGTITATTVTVAAKTPIKPDPYGVFAGGKFFAAYAVKFLRANLHSDDVQAYQLVAIDGAIQVPPNTVTVRISGLLVGDSTGVYRHTSGVINKTSGAGTYVPTDTAVAATSITVTTAIATDTPKHASFDGFLRIINATTPDVAFQEHRYRYSSWTGSTFTLTPVTSGQDAAMTATAATQGTDGLLTVTLGTAIDPYNLVGGVFVGDMVYTYVNGVPGTPLSWGSVVSIIDTTHVKVRVYETVTLSDWSGTGNHIAFNTVVRTIEQDDDYAYVPLIDTYINTGTTIENSLIYSSDIAVLARVRAKGVIIPFEQLATVSSTGLTISAVRTADTIAS